jgi:hypothetical protein
LLGQHQYVARLSAGIGEYFAGRYYSRNDEAILWFRVLNGVPTNDFDPRFARLVATTFQDLAQHLKWNLLCGKTDNVQREQRPAPHGIHVAERIGRRDLSVFVWGIHDRSDKVHRLDNGSLVVDAIGRSVIGRRCSHENSRIFYWGQVTQDLRQVFGTYLARSPAAAG